MAVLLMRLEGVLQSWGYRSRFQDRDTGTEPSKSGVIGLLYCALGRDRSVPPTDLAALRMHVRVDLEGKVLTDFHTAGGGDFRGRPYRMLHADGSVKERTVISSRHYLQGASFLVALEGDTNLLRTLHEALADPAWPLFLGRKSCPPSHPVWIEDGLHEDLDEALGTFVDPHAGAKAGAQVRIVSELPAGDYDGDPRRDVPVAWASQADRRYDVRYVRTHTATVRGLAS